MFYFRLKTIPMSFKSIVTTDWLQAHLHDAKLIVLDASMAPVGGSKSIESSAVIPRSIRFDLKSEFSDADSRYSNTLLPESAFIAKIQGLGISDDSVLVVVDSEGVYSSPRAYYMIKAFGHEEVYVLDGGLPAWLGEKRPTVEEYRAPNELGNFSKRLGQGYFCSADEVLTFMDQNDRKILDARSKNRFLGLEGEPRAGLALGHIPRSVNLPYTAVLEGGKFKSVEALGVLFSGLCLENKSLVTSCGSGVTACIVAMAAQIVGIQDVLIYDGSWSEWGDLDNAFPIENG
jgi:thiosulfate/3-mercaptopyruvate sulfurtransferase